LLGAAARYVGGIIQRMGSPEVSEIASSLSLEEFDVSNAHVVFDQQDSGSVSWGVTAAGRRWFVKQAGSRRAHDSLANCLRLHEHVHHDAIVRPVRVFEGERRTLLYPWVPGTVLNAATRAGTDRSGLDRFRSLPLAPVLDAITAVLDTHQLVADAGFVAIDFYDGCLLYDFDALTVRLIDLDEYRPGPFILDEERLPGSRSYMAPEELRRGAVIDERTTVFNLGRMIQHLLDAPTGWRGSPTQAAIRKRATADAPAARFRTVAELNAAWTASLR
jgi:serine/threonine-protein kinase